MLFWIFDTGTGVCNGHVAQTGRTGFGQDSGVNDKAESTALINLARTEPYLRSPSIFAVEHEELAENGTSSTGIGTST